ncbi:MAG: hypothetical protein B7Z66_01050 [Chromatiales bacterium 21-64-14]|nr:MAG: hypothetical protein B7Z66_01050 [Chromatiales bacterium 21-64-14]HQU16041.1 hypothetical protein [Gammaproteobacteria bacterium]
MASVHTKALFISALLLIFGASQASAAERLKPFELAYTANGDMAQVVTQVKQKLTANGFDIVGSYAPYTDAKFSNGEVVSAEVIGVTNDALKKAAAETKFGGYAIVQRVTVTKVTNNGTTQVQVAYTNPTYMANAYRLKSDLADVSAQLGKALGAQKAYGSQNGLTASDLRDYHYKFLMPYFTDPDTLAKYGSYQEAVNAVNAGLAAHKGGVSKVYEVAVPGKDETLFGVALSGPSDNACSGDQYIMAKIDFHNTKSTGHLPYGILVAGDHVYALGAKFRIAINFPDLSMMGDNSFMSIMCAPGSIEKALEDAAKGA